MDKASPTDSDFGASLGLALTGLDITDFITESIASNEPSEATDPIDLTFQLFPNLVVELRLKIWKLSLVLRTVAFIPGGGRTPAILAVSRESREVGLKHYALYKCSKPASGYFASRNAKRAHFGFFLNPSLDLVWPGTLESSIC